MAVECLHIIHINFLASNGHAPAVGSGILPRRPGHDFGARLIYVFSGTSDTVAGVSPSILLYPTSTTQPILQTRLYTTTTVSEGQAGKSWDL